MREYIKHLGMHNKRAKTIIRMSKQLSEGFESVKQLYGCGKYADNSDRIFYLGLWRETEPSDGALKRYKNFLERHYENQGES